MAACSCHTSEIAWIKLSNQIWWPAKILKEDQNDPFSFRIQNVNRAQLLGTTKIVAINVTDESTVRLEGSNNVEFKQEIPVSLRIMYDHAITELSEISSHLQGLQNVSDPNGVAPNLSESNITQTVVEEYRNTFTQDDAISSIHNSFESGALPYLTATKKRNDFIPWDEYFMAVASLSSMRSKDPSTQVGACIVNKEKRIVGIGYNGFPRGCSDDDLPWAKEAADELDTKYPVHSNIHE